MLTFTQKKPHPALRNFIQGYWLTEAGTASEVLDLVPDGYPELFFVLKESVQIFSEGQRWQAASSAGIIGQVTGRFTFEPAAFSKVLYVKLYPWALSHLFRIPAWELNDLAVEIEVLTNDPAFRSLAEAVCAVESFVDAIALLDTFFLKKMTNLAPKNPFLHFSVHQIYASNGTLGVSNMAANIHASHRYIEKLFKQEIGISPKQYARIIRVKKASMFMLDPKFRGNLNQISANLDYYDQSHFLKDFRAVVRQSPTEFLQHSLQFSNEDIPAYLGQWDYS